MKNKTELKVKQKRSTKPRKHTESQVGKCQADALKSQQSAFVKEKIKEILEDGQKKTFITLKSRHETPAANHLENRISVIRSVSSLFDEQKQIFSSSMAFQFNDEQSSIHV